MEDEEIQARDITGLPVLRTVERVRWQPTVDGCWEFIQLTRELKGLAREGRRPKRFAPWFAEAIEFAGPEGIETVLRGYFSDGTIKAKDWPTGVFIGGVWEARARPKETPAQVTASVLNGT